MITLWLAAALANPPQVQGLEWAAAYQLATPYPYSHLASAPLAAEVWLLQLRVELAGARVSQGRAPVLMVGDTPAWRLNWDHVGGCAVVAVPGPLDLTTAAVFFGPTALPLELDAATRARVASQAQPSFSSEQVKAARQPGVSHVADMRDVLRAAADRIEGCTASEDDRARLWGYRAGG